MKKFLTFILVLAMVLSVSSVAMAAGGLPDVDGEGKIKLTSGTYTLTSNVTLEASQAIEVPADATVVLDLNGYVLSQTKAQTEGYQMILNDGNLTIKDSVGTGKISYTDSGNGGEYISDTIYNRSILVINGGTIENLSSDTVASNGYPHAVDTYSGIRDTSVTINGGTIYCKEYSAIRMFCVSATNKADLIINEGATIKGAVDMQNGTKNSALGSLKINGGTFETTKNSNNIRFANWNGGAVEYGITASIAGGSFDGGITTEYVPADANWDSKIISGGTFSEKPAAALIDTGKVALPEGDGDDYVIGVQQNGASIHVAPTSLDFGSAEYGYSAIPAKQLIITNNGNKPVTLAEAVNTAYDFSPAIGGRTLEVGESKTIDVSPKAGLNVGSYNATITVTKTAPAESAGLDATRATATVSYDINLKFTVTAKPSSGYSGPGLWHIGGNTFGTTTNRVPTQVEIDGNPVSFTMNGSSFTVSCVKPDSRWITARWGTVSNTVRFTPDAQSFCTQTVIPKTGDVSVVAYALMAVVAAAGAMLKK